MSSKKTGHPEIPPKLPGNYRIRDADGDIIYWGDTVNLYAAWCKRVWNHFFSENETFEYSLTDPIETRHK